MDRRAFLNAAGNAMVVVGGSLIFPQLVLGSPRQHSNVEEYCFSISPGKSIAMRSVDTTPEGFLRNTPRVDAAINGLYFSPDNRIEGIAYLADNWHFATQRKEHTRGYFTVNRKGDTINVSESLDGKITDYFLVLGTHPLLVTKGEANSQSREDRYGGRKSYRSAIGTKNGKDICFAVSTDAILMNEWAERLRQAGYYGALNLDGGPISQMALRDSTGGISVKGKGSGNTKLVIFSYTR